MCNCVKQFLAPFLVIGACSRRCTRGCIKPKPNRHVRRCHWHTCGTTRCAREQRVGQLKESRKGASKGRQLHVDVWRRRNTTRVSGEQNARGMCAKYRNFRDMRYMPSAKEIHAYTCLSLSLSLSIHLSLSLFFFPRLLVARTRSTILGDRENRGKRLSLSLIHI